MNENVKIQLAVSALKVVEELLDCPEVPQKVLWNASMVASLLFDLVRNKLTPEDERLIIERFTRMTERVAIHREPKF